MITVKAPEGLDAVRYLDSGRGWVVAARRVGSDWWRDLSVIGSRYMTPDELDRRAEARVVCPVLGFHAFDRHANRASEVTP